MLRPADHVCFQNHEHFKACIYAMIAAPARYFAVMDSYYVFIACCLVCDVRLAPLAKSVDRSDEIRIQIIIVARADRTSIRFRACNHVRERISAVTVRYNVQITRLSWKLTPVTAKTESDGL